MRIPAFLLVCAILGAATEARSELIMCPTALRSDCQASEDPGTNEPIKPFMCERHDCRVLPPVLHDGVRVCSVTCIQHFY